MADNFVLLPAENDFSDRVRGGLGQDLQTELAGSGLVMLEGIPSDFEAQLQTVLDEGATLITNFERHDQTPAQPESESHSDLQSSAQSSNSLELQGEGVVDMHATPANSSVAVTAETKADQILTKAGYDYIFHDSELASEYNCAICLSVARNPQQTKCCGTTFCHYCIMRALKSSKVGCSICNKEDVELIPDKAQRQKINKLKVQCPIVGCAWIVELADIEAHKKKPHPLSPPLTSPHSTLQRQQRKKQQQLDQFLTSSEQQQQQQSEEPVISVRQKPPIPTPRKLSNVPQLRPENDDALPDYVNTTVIRPVTDQSLREHLPDYVNTTVIRPVTDQSLREHLPDYVNTTVIRPVTDREQPAKLTDEMPEYLNLTLPRPRVPRNQKASKRSQSSPPSPKRLKMAHYVNLNQSSSLPSHSPSPPLLPELNQLVPLQNQMQPFTDQPQVQSPSQSLLHDEMAIYENVNLPTPPLDEFGLPPFQSDPNLVPEVPTTTEGVPDYLNITLPRVRPRVPSNTNVHEGSQTPPSSPNQHNTFQYINLEQPSPSQSPPLPPDLVPLLSLLDEPMSLQNQMQPFSDQLTNQPSNFPLSPSPPPDLPPPLISLPPPLLSLIQPLPEQPPQQNQSQPLINTATYENITQSPPLQGTNELYVDVSLLQETPKLTFPWANQPECIDMFQPQGANQLQPEYVDMFQPQGANQLQPEYADMFQPQGDISQSQGAMEYASVSQPQGANESDMSQTQGPEYIDMSRPQGANQEYASVFQPQRANQPEYVDMSKTQGANQAEYVDMSRPQGANQEYASVSQPQRANQPEYVDMSKTQGANQPEYVDMSRPQGANQEYASVSQPQRANESDYADMSQTQGANQPEYVDMSRSQGANQEYASVSQPQRANESDYAGMSQTQGVNQPEYVDMSRPQGANQEYASVSQPQRAKESDYVDMSQTQGENQPEYVDMSRPQGANQEYASVSQPQRANESDYVDMSQTQGANQPEYVDMSRPQGANQEYASVSQPQRANESDYADMSQTQGANQPEYVDMSRPQGANQEYASVSQPQGVNESGVSQPHQEANADALPRQLPTPPVVQNQSATIPQSEAAAAAAAANYATIVSNTDTTDHIYEPLLPPCSPPPEEPDPEPAMYANLPIPLPPPPPPLPPRDPPAAQPTQEPPPPLPPRTPTPTSEQPVQPEEEQPPPLPAHNERALSLPLDATPQPHEAENQPQPVLEGGHSQIELQQGNADDIAESAPPRYDDLSQTPLQPAPNQDVLIILNRHVDNTPPTQGGDGPLRTENIDIRYELGDVHQENKRKRKTKIIL